MVVYGAKVSYFTGKFETYLRYKEIPYTYRALDLRHYYWVIPRHLGAAQYPTVRLPDGRWMSDSTPMIGWLERHHPDRPLLDGVPADLSPLLREIGTTHLQALTANAIAHAAGSWKHDLQIQGTTYRLVPTSAYRVWCLEQLRERFDELPQDAADQVRAILEQHGCWELLWSAGGLASGHDPAGEAPFCRALRMVRD
jgi:glutathione S-transferase